MSSRARRWPYLVIALVVYMGAPGTPPGLTVVDRDGQTTVERSPAAVRPSVAAGARAGVLALPALPAPAIALPPAPDAVPHRATVTVLPSVAGRPLTAASARAPPSPPHVP
jgi:hypothetical protein